MTFLAPILLFGLLATLIPPILHLLNRKEAKPIIFPAMEFLRRAYRKTARRMKIKQWLLIFLRCLLLALLTLSLARPYWQPERNPEVETATQGSIDGAHVIIIDSSYPMGFKVQDHSLIELAKIHTLNILDDAQTPVSLVIANHSPYAPVGEPTEDYASIREAVEQVKVTPSNGSMSESVSLAFQLLRDRPISETKRITLLTTPRTARATLPATPPTLGKVEVRAVDLSTSSVNGVGTQERNAELNNHALLSVQVEPAPQIGVGHWRVEAEVANYSNTPMDLWPIWVELEGEVKVRGFLTLAAGEVGRKRFYFKAEVSPTQSATHEDSHTTSRADSSSRTHTTAHSASHRQTMNTREGKDVLKVFKGLKGYIVLGSDALTVDDRRAFWVEPTPPTHILALNGDPRPTPHEDELFYLQHALSPKVTGGDRFQITARPFTGSGLLAQDLSGVDVVLLANIPRPSLEFASILTDFVQRGGGLWITPGGRVDVEEWNRTLSPLLPRPLRGIRRAGDAASIQNRSVAHLSQFIQRHSLLTLFPDPMRSTLSQTNIWTYMLFDPNPTPQSEVIASLNEGSPYLLTREVGEGRVVLWGGPIDREWSDFVIQADFVPFVQQVARYLTKRTSDLSRQVIYSTPFEIELNGEGPFSSLSPLGERKVMRQVNTKGGLHMWQTHQTRPLGHHLILTSTNKEVSRFVVQLDASVSDLRLYKMGGEGQLESERDAEMMAQRATLQIGSRKELWHSGLFGIFLLLLFEGVVLYQRHRGESLRGEVSRGGLRVASSRGEVSA